MIENNEHSIQLAALGSDARHISVKTTSTREYLRGSAISGRSNRFGQLSNRSSGYLLPNQITVCIGRKHLWMTGTSTTGYNLPDEEMKLDTCDDLYDKER